jgi:hypothetical protein
MENKKKETAPFVKYHTGLSLLFSPVEMIFALQMVNYEYLKSNGYRVSLSKAEYARRMGMKEYTFEKCVSRFSEMNLLKRNYNALGNRVFYSFNRELYGKLLRIVAQTSDPEKLSLLFNRLKKESCALESFTEEEINALKD